MQHLAGTDTKEQNYIIADAKCCRFMRKKVPCLTVTFLTVLLLIIIVSSLAMGSFSCYSFRNMD